MRLFAGECREPVLCIFYAQVHYSYSRKSAKYKKRIKEKLLLAHTHTHTVLMVGDAMIMMLRNALNNKWRNIDEKMR